MPPLFPAAITLGESSDPRNVRRDRAKARPYLCAGGGRVPHIASTTAAPKRVQPWVDKVTERAPPRAAVRPLVLVARAAINWSISNRPRGLARNGMAKWDASNWWHRQACYECGAPRPGKYTQGLQSTDMCSELSLAILYIFLLRLTSPTTHPIATLGCHAILQLEAP